MFLALIAIALAYGCGFWMGVVKTVERMAQYGVQ